MHFFGSNPEPEQPGGLIDMICYFRYDLDPIIAMKASKTTLYLRATSFATDDCTFVFEEKDKRT